MTPREYKTILQQLNVSHGELAAATGVTRRSSFRWAAGDIAVPWWMETVLRYWLKTGIRPDELERKAA